MNIPDDSDLIKRLSTRAAMHSLLEDADSAQLLVSAADRITELRMVRTMLYQRLNNLCDDNAELQRRVAELEAMV